MSLFKSNPYKGLTTSQIKSVAQEELKAAQDVFDAKLAKATAELKIANSAVSEETRKALDKRRDAIADTFEVLGVREKSLQEQLDAVKAKRAALLDEIDLLDGRKDGAYFGESIDVQA